MRNDTAAWRPAGKLSDAEYFDRGLYPEFCLSSPRACAAGGREDHLSVAAHSALPPHPQADGGGGRAVRNACLALLRAGFAMLPPLFFVLKNWGGTVRSYRTFSPLPRSFGFVAPAVGHTKADRPGFLGQKGGAVCFLLHFPLPGDMAPGPRPMAVPFPLRESRSGFGPAPCLMEFGSSSPR